MSAAIIFDSEESWAVTSGLFGLVLEEIAATVTSTGLSEELLFIVENNFGGVMVSKLTASDQLEFLRAITGDLRDKIMAEISADNAIRHLTTARLDDLVQKAQNQLRLRAAET